MKTKFFKTALLAVSVLIIGSSAFAAEFEVTQYTADTNEILIQTNGEIPDLENYITIKENGETIDGITVNKIEQASNYHSSFIKDTIYSIKNTDGFKIGEEYNLVINTGGETVFDKSFYLENYFSEDFSEDSGNMLFVHSNPSVTWQGNNTAEVKDGALEIRTGEKNSYEPVLVSENYKDLMSAEDYTAEFDAEVIDKGNSSNFFKVGFTTSASLNDVNNTNKLVRFHFQSNCIRTYVVGDGGFIAAINVEDTLSSGSQKYTHVKIVGNGTRQTLYVNGIRCSDYDSVNCAPAKGAFAMIFLGDNATYRIDNYRLTKMVECVNVTADKELCDVTDKVVLSVEDSFDTESFTQDLISVESSDGNAVKFEATADDEHTITLNFSSPLEYKTEYNVQINRELVLKDKKSYSFRMCSFKTIPPSFDLDSFSVTDGLAYAVIKNNRSEEPVTSVITLVFYDEHNMMIGITGGKNTLSIGEEKTIEHTAPNGTRLVKCYVLDSYASLNTMFEETIYVE